MNRLWAGFAVVAAAVCSGVSVGEPSPAFGFADIRRCTFDPVGNAVFSALMSTSGDGRAGFVHDDHVKLAGAAVPIVFAATKDAATGYVTYRSEAVFDSALDWNGLLLTGFAAEEFAPPDVDGMSIRELHFRDTGDRVRAALNRLGSDIGAKSETFIDDEACGGSLRLIESAGGTIVRCEWGC